MLTTWNTSLQYGRAAFYLLSLEGLLNRLKATFDSHVSVNGSEVQEVGEEDYKRRAGMLDAVTSAIVDVTKFRVDGMHRA